MMLKEDFTILCQERSKQSKCIAETAAQLHASVNQIYDTDLPYSFHLRLAASYATRFGHLVLNEEKDFDTLMAATYFHDTIEDARLSYNDLKKIFTRLNDEGCSINIAAAAEIVYALTNDKGRSRQERAGEKYYEGIRSTPYAPFVKMCDRLANIRYSTLFFEQSRMAEIYRKEHPHFLASIGDVPQEMAAEAERMLGEIA